MLSKKVIRRKIYERMNKRVSSPDSKNLSLSTVALLVSEIEWVKKVSFYLSRRQFYVRYENESIATTSFSDICFQVRYKKKRMNYKQMADDRWFLAD